MDNHTTLEVNYIKDYFKLYLRKWPWFFLSSLFFFVLAFLYIRYSTPQYEATSKIQIVDEKAGTGGMQIFQELDVFSGSSHKVEDEIEILNSRSNFVEVVRKLGLNTQIIAVGRIKSTELYTKAPVQVNLIAHDSVLAKANFSFYVTLSSNSTYGYSVEENSPEKAYAYGKNIQTPMGDIVVTPDLDYFDMYRGKRLKINIRPLTRMGEAYRKRLNVSVADKFSNIVLLSIKDPVPQKAVDILNALVGIYNNNAIEDKRIIADRTASFINERIADISNNLSSVDQTAEDFKTERGLTDIQSEASVNLNVGVANQQELAQARTQLNIASSMQDMVNQQEGYDVLPSNLGFNDPGIVNTTQQYNRLVQERKRLLKSSNEKNPVIVNLDEQLEGLKQSLLSSLGGTVNSLGLQVNTLSGQQAIFNSRRFSAPKNERALRDITRKQQTTESLYLYLLEKREEAQLAYAATAPKSKIVDRAYNPSDFPVSPRKKIIYLSSILLGLLLPFSVIYIHHFLDNKIQNMHSLEKLAKDTPILGELPKLSKNKQKLIVKEDRSVLGEALRIIRTNLDYLIKTKSSPGNKNNVIFITSSVPGEGKTFLSTNLAMILSSTQKKVLLMGGDVRNPKFYAFFSGVQSGPKKTDQQRKRDVGLTDYIYDDKVGAGDIINQVKVFDNAFDVIYSGRIPPNPAELLMSPKIGQLIEKVSAEYDYVLVDTAPLMVVSDTLLISQYADHTIYVTRAGYSDQKVVDFPLKLQGSGKIKGLSFVVNDVKDHDLGYGGQYGYGYGKSTTKWWKVFG